MNKIKEFAKITFCIAVFACGMVLEAATVKVPKPTVSKGTYSTLVKVSWSKVSGATGGYYIKRGTTSTYADAILLVKCAAKSTYYLDSSAVVGKTYYYWVCPIVDKTVYYNASAYAYGYRKGTSSSGSGSSASSGATASGSYISGLDRLSYGRHAYYYLYVNGVKIESLTGVKWSCTGKAYMMNTIGLSGELLADTKPSKTFTVTVKAVYKKKTYTKKVTIDNSNTYGQTTKVVQPVWMTCSKHGRYNGAYTLGKCPKCLGTISSFENK